MPDSFEKEPTIVEFEDFAKTDKALAALHMIILRDIYDEDYVNALFQERLTALDVPQMVRKRLQGLPYKEQLYRYIFEAKGIREDKSIGKYVRPPWHKINKILVKDGVVLGLTMRDSYFDDWTFVMRQEWVDYNYRWRYNENPPYDKRTIWIQPAMNLLLDDGRVLRY